MKALILLALLFVGSYATTEVDCQKYFVRGIDASKKLHTNEGTQFFIKWASISTMNMTIYNGCMANVHHDELIKTLKGLDLTAEASTSEDYSVKPVSAY